MTNTNDTRELTGGHPNPEVRAAYLRALQAVTDHDTGVDAPAHESDLVDA